ncbi:TPA: ABC transporter permease [Klebsiella quasipneumoniae subsp. similipneumoniae]|jgi:lipopolysaccharide transport system permease protein|uniref:ABC transporter permease n=1 Tax=Klebsiella pneumoniae complex TaxID=3390273 RepID=UPI000BBB6DCB|nr:MULTISPECIES: ABC transporter permease [Klebsiella]MBC4461148.1 ABC transporter permease [Klebsiella pneumoniae]MBC4775883.1 ABC transporter permease [Klebsiella pneumoniae]MBQ5008430.1 ABC transporter permease [Klebsiella pneumoniae]MCP5888240.1 ABC transporter permease [Klebsiella pneumoniae]MCW9429586.1 ABC transporter permease [Klebsiella pneumoniae]
MKMITNSIGLNDLVSALKSFHIITMMGGQDIRQRYKRSRLGPFWITISMAVMITTMGLVFGNLFKTDVKEFLPFLTLGLIIWSFILGSITEGCEALISAEGIIKQLPVPLHVHVLRVVWKNFIIFLHNIVIFPFVLLAVGKGVSWDIFLAIPGFLLLVLNLSWFLMIIAMVCARFRDMTQIILSIMQVVFYLTPVIWMPKLLSHRVGQVLLDLNPLYHLIDIVRAPLLGQVPALSSYILAMVMGIIGLVFSTIMTSKYKYRVPYWV